MLRVRACVNVDWKLCLCVNDLAVADANSCYFGICNVVVHVYVSFNQCGFNVQQLYLSFWLL